MELEWRHYLQLVRRWWWLLVLGPLVGASVAFAVTARGEPEYTAEVLLRVNPVHIGELLTYDDLLNSETLAKTYRSMVWTQPVLGPVIEDLGLNESVADLGTKLRAWQVADTQLMQLSFTDDDPTAAAEIANAVAGSLAREVSNESTELSTTVRATIDKQLADSQQQILETSEQIQTLEQSPSVANPSIQAQLSGLRTQLDQLQDLYGERLQTAQLMDINAEIARYQLTVAAAAEVPTTSSVTSPKLSIAFGALAGLLIGAAAVAGLGFLDNTVRAGTDFTSLVGAPRLSAIPERSNLPAGPEQLFVLTQPKSDAAEAIRMLRINLELATSANQIKTLAITSPGPGEGKSTIAANLAVALAQTGLSTMLIDADLRRPTLHQIFDTPNEYGLSTSLADSHESWQSLVIQTSIPNLRFLPSGPVPHNPADLLSLDRLPRMLRELAETTEILILDTPTVEAGSDALVVAANIDALMLVCRSEKTRLDALRWAARVLRPAGARVVGVVLNRESRRDDGYFGYAKEQTLLRERAPAFLHLGSQVHRRPTEPALAESGPRASS
jgi:non-specific protein-tyrosine kinase